MDLHTLGWRPIFAASFEPHRVSGWRPARVVEEHRERYIVLGEGGESRAEVTGRLRFTADSRFDFPAVGDWVVVEPADDSTVVIHAVLPRATVFARKAVGRTTELQVLAANVDSAWIVTDSDRDFNLRRIERYLTLARESGVPPVVVLNKSDLCDRCATLIDEVRSIAPDVPVLSVSAATQSGMEVLRARITEGRTVALFGSSGVGKTSIVNRLLGEERLETSRIRESDGRGRHTTSRRQLLLLPDGGMVIDTPGMRELGLWMDAEDVDAEFEDIEALARGCRFTDCRHAGEPGCAVAQAIEAGTLSRGRLQNYVKLGRESRFLETRRDVRAALEEKARWKKLHRVGRENMRRKYGPRG